VIEISKEPQRKILIDRIIKIGANIKKQKSHARHVFTFLEKNYNIFIQTADDDENKSKKIERKSMGVKNLKIRGPDILD
jgi:hypothetical protein